MKNLLYTLLFLVSTLNAVAVAPTSGDGTSGNPWQIANLDNLEWLSTTSGEWITEKYFIQTADINASDTTTWNGGEGFSPIGNFSDRFRANYDGQNHTISGLYINSAPVNSTYPGLGFFGWVHGGIIKNIVLYHHHLT